MLATKYDTFLAAGTLAELLAKTGKELPEVLVTVAVGSGLTVTARLWGGFLAELIHVRLTRSALHLGILAVFPFSG